MWNGSLAEGMVGGVRGACGSSIQAPRSKLLPSFPPVLARDPASLCYERMPCETTSYKHRRPVWLVPRFDARCRLCSCSAGGSTNVSVAQAVTVLLRRAQLARTPGLDRMSRERR